MSNNITYSTNYYRLTEDNFKEVLERMSNLMNNYRATVSNRLINSVTGRKIKRYMSTGFWKTGEDKLYGDNLRFVYVTEHPYRQSHPDYMKDSCTEDKIFIHIRTGKFRMFILRKGDHVIFEDMGKIVIYTLDGIISDTIVKHTIRVINDSPIYNLKDEIESYESDIKIDYGVIDYYD